MLNIDWNAPKTPCKTEGCNWPNYHVCLVGKEDRTHEFPELCRPYIPGQRGRASRAGEGRFGYMTEEHKEALRQAQNRIWADRLAANAPRNKQIVADYDSGLGIRELRAKYGIGHGTVVKILHDARDRGEVVIRTRGYMEYGKRITKTA